MPKTKKHGRLKEMKFIAAICIIVCLAVFPAAAATYLEDVRNLGYVSGEGLACGAERYPSYELIARAYLVSKARSDSEQADGMYEYNKAKATAFMEKRGDGYFGCDEVNRRFNNQKIFKSTLYKNGTIKFPDGKVIKPRRAYNVNLVYNRNENEREKLNAYYDRVMAKKKQRAAREGIYQKIKQEEIKARQL